MHKHLPALDGLRGVAVVIVVVPHTTPLYASGAFGVDIFFVLSGFLISSILARELAGAGRVALGRFYGRRFLRLMPALWLTLVGVAAVELAQGQFDRSLLYELVFAATYVMNWVSAFGLGEPHLLEHTWSLAIEEQYYLIWPFALTGLAATRAPLRVQAGVLAAAAAGVMAYRAACGFEPIRIYRGLDTHCDGLLLGSALALFLLGGGSENRVVRTVRSLLAPFALLALVLMPVGYGWADQETILWGYSLVAVLSALVIWDLAANENSFLGRALSMPLLVGIGKVSYGVYLYHWPILQWIEATPLEDWVKQYSWTASQFVPFLSCVAVTAVVAWASYVWVERPALRLKDRWFRSKAHNP